MSKSIKDKKARKQHKQARSLKRQRRDLLALQGDCTIPERKHKRG